MRRPYRLQLILGAIEQSKRILDLKENWDDEGSCGYSQEVWDRSTTFLRQCAEQSPYSVIDPPGILPGPNGSIDLYWKTEKCTLLVNFPSDANEKVSFYGDKSSGGKVKGLLALQDNNFWLYLWLVRA